MRWRRGCFIAGLALSGAAHGQPPAQAPQTQAPQTPTPAHEIEAAVDGAYINGQRAVGDDRMRMQGIMLRGEIRWRAWSLTLGGRRLSLSDAGRTDPLPSVDGSSADGEAAEMSDAPPRAAARAPWAASALVGWRRSWVALSAGVSWRQDLQPTPQGELAPAAQVRLGPEALYLDAATGVIGDATPIPGLHRLGVNAGLGEARAWLGVISDVSRPGSDRPLALSLGGAVPLGGDVHFGVAGALVPGDLDEYLCLQAQLGWAHGW